MTIEQWGIVAGLCLTCAVAITPWMFMVHAKLAVLTAAVNLLQDKIDTLSQREIDRPCREHAVRLGDLERRVSTVEHE